MATTVIPTLGTTTLVSDPSTKIAYVLRQYAAAPKHATITWLAETISLQHTLSLYGTNKEEVVEPITTDLTTVYRRVFPDADSVTVNVTTSDVVDKAAYNIQISVSVVIAGTPYSLSHTTTVEDGRLVFGD